MSSSNSTDNTTSFSLCEQIAEFYEKKGVPSRKTEGPFEGKSYSWHVGTNNQAFKIRCFCNFFTVGYGVLSMQSRMASSECMPRLFKHCSPVDPKTGSVNLTGILFRTHQITLPVPDSDYKDMKKTLQNIQSEMSKLNSKVSDNTFPGNWSYP